MAEGSWLVIAFGAIVLMLGFFASSALPQILVTSAEIGYFFALLGSMLLIAGMVKLKVGEKRVSPELPTKL